MVHLGRVSTDLEIKEKNLPREMGKSSLDEESEQDLYTSSVYGSRFAARDLPKYEIPEDEMPKDIAYRMIKYVASLLLV